MAVNGLTTFTRRWAVGFGLFLGLAASSALTLAGPTPETVLTPTAVQRLAAEGGSSAVGDLAETCAINSFTAGTLVLMGDGSKKAIDLVKVGDVVMAGDPQKGTERAEPVKAVIVGHGLKHLVQLHIDGDVIDATHNHPFWSVTNQKFEWAQDLTVGEQVLLADGRAPPIESISTYDETTTVFNLSIQDIHTFYVGSASILVHNSCYSSFDAFKRAEGSAGDGMDWHHIVEQSQIGKSGFGTSAINSTENLIPLSRDIHSEVSGYYNSVQQFTGGLRVRNWLAGRSFDYQYEFGTNLRSLGVDI